MQLINTARPMFDNQTSNQSYAVKKVKHPELGIYAYSLFCKK